MPKLPRTAIPVEVKCRVALRQLGYPIDLIDAAIRINKRSIGKFLAGLLPNLALALHCEVKELRLDHNPALGLREKIRNEAGDIIGYIPHEHSVDDLLYRSQHAHHIKTNVAGDGAQFSDTVLMKRERRRQRRQKPERHKRKAWPQGAKIRSRGFEKRR